MRKPHFQKQLGVAGCKHEGWLQFHQQLSFRKLRLERGMTDRAYTVSVGDAQNSRGFVPIPVPDLGKEVIGG
jgi:hypothetical protein